MLNTIFIGYDSREKVAYDVLVQSICRKSSRQVMVMDSVKDFLHTSFNFPCLVVVPLKHHELRSMGLFNRKWITREDGQRVDAIDGKPFSVEFSHSRFIVPHLQKSGWALFMDCDMLFTKDPCELDKFCDSKFAVHCVKHDHQPKETIKMDQQVQESYPMKNWSSVVLWNCSHPKNRSITPDVVNSHPGSYLHRFSWLTEKDIGELPRKWNMLIGYYDDASTASAANIHYTLGSPFMDGYENCDRSDEWWSEYGRLMWRKLK